MMGRVSKHKRIKACDPFYKGPRRVDPRVDDLPPESPDDQPMPKTLSRLLRSSQQIAEAGKKKKVTSNNGGAQGQFEDGGRTSSRKDDGLSKSADDGRRRRSNQDRGEQELTFKRKKGESLKAYLERIDIESNSRMMEAHRKSRVQSERRKRYFEKRRKRLKGQRDDKDLNQESQIVEFHDLKDKVHFGEVAHEPPRLKAKPRGSAKGTRKSKSDSLLLLGKLEPSAGKSKTDSPDIKPGGLKRQRDIEMEREKAIEHYRSIKKARTKKQ